MIHDGEYTTIIYGCGVCTIHVQHTMFIARRCVKMKGGGTSWNLWRIDFANAQHGEEAQQEDEVSTAGQEMIILMFFHT